MNIPKLRFKEFEGEWVEKRLGEIATFFSGGTPTSTNKDYYSGTIPFIGSGNIKSEKVEQFISEEALKNSSSKMVKVGDLLYALYGATSGEVAISKINGAINQAVLCIRSSENVYFLYYWLSLKKEKILTKYLQGGQGNLSAKIIKNLCLLLPQKQEQQKIATFLSTIDQKIEQLTKKKTLLESYKKGVMQKIFSQEIRFKRDDGGEFEDWEEKKLGDVATFSKGKGISKSDIVENGTIECIRYGELYTHYNETIYDIKSSTNLDRENLVLSQYNDVIIPASGETQIDIATASCVLKDNIALSGDLNIIRTNEDGVFLSYYLNSFKRFDIARLAQGISVVHLYSSQLKQLKLNLPQMEEQKKIATFLTSLDQKITQTTQQIEAMKRFKKGLLQGMFV